MNSRQGMAILRVLLALAIVFGQAPYLTAQQLTVTSYGQTEDQRTLLATQSGNATIIFDVRPGMTSHQITFVVSPSVSALTVTVTGSATGQNGSFAACGNSSALGATITCTGTYNALKVAYTAFAGSGTVDATYFGASSFTPSTTVAITGTVNVDPVANTIGLATVAKQDTGNTALAAIKTAVESTAPVVVKGNGTAGTADSAPITVQGIASMTPVLTQPASATAPVNTMNSSTANAGLNAALAGLCDDTSPTGITENSFGFLRMNCTTHSLNVNSTPQVATSGGATPGSWISDNSSTSFVIKASAGQLYALDITNKLAAVMYVRAYNTTTATCTSATGIVGRWIIPVAATGAGGTFHIPIQGYAFGTGISICITTTVSDTDNTAIAANSAVATYGFN